MHIYISMRSARVYLCECDAGVVPTEWIKLHKLHQFDGEYSKTIMQKSFERYAKPMFHARCECESVLLYILLYSLHS